MHHTVQRERVFSAERRSCSFFPLFFWFSLVLCVYKFTAKIFRLSRRQIVRLEDWNKTSAALTMTVWIGIALSCTASFMNALGLNLQRLAGDNNATLKFIGILFSTLCGIVDVTSFLFAPQSMLAPLGSTTLIFNLFLAPVLHSESIIMRDVLLTIVVVMGVILCITSSSSGEDDGDNAVTTSSDLYLLSQAPAFQLLVGAVMCLCVALSYHLVSSQHDGRGALLSTGFVYPVLAGIFGGATTLLAKMITVIGVSMENLSSSLPLGIMCGACAASQVIINGKGLAKHSSLVMVPIYSSTFVLSNAVGGGIFFQEFNKFTQEQWLSYGGGVALVVGGVLVMAAAKQREITERKKELKNGKTE